MIADETPARNMMDDDFDDMPMVYGRGEQFVPNSLKKDQTVKLIRKASDAARGIEACLDMIIFNNVTRDTDGQVLMDKYHEEGLLLAAIAAANYITNEGERFIDDLEADRKEALASMPVQST